MISLDDVVVGCGRDGRGRSASMKGHAAVPKAVDEILIERRTGLTVDVAAEEEGDRPRPRKWRSVYGKRRFELLLLLHPSRLKAVAQSSNQPRRHHKEELEIPVDTDGRRSLRHSANPRLVCPLSLIAICKINIRGSQIIPH